MWGLKVGYCLMIGGEKGSRAAPRPDLFPRFAPGVGTIDCAPKAKRRGHDQRAEHGYIHAGPVGSGHFVKMVHNGIEYGMMQALR